ncbi:MAG: hypothetical protein HWE34_02490 [Methylocystaceae bacterium]|nr:hypothetical protein [Methylocystaceae bacterium]
MSTSSGPIGLAWKSKSGRKASWAVALVSFALVVILGSLLRIEEQKLRQETLTQFARTLASTTLSAGGEEDDILMKVNDLLNVDAVLGVRLLKGDDTPLSVGDLPDHFPTNINDRNRQISWNETATQLDVAFPLDPLLPFDWLVMRIDSSMQMSAPIFGTLINWIAAPIIAFINALVCLWVIGVYHLKPLRRLQNYFEENKGSFTSAPVPAELNTDGDETSLVAKQIEVLRTEVNDAKNKAEDQARFLHETPYPLLRCSVNRKVLYANAAARKQNALFGDDSREFVSPAISELVRKAFYETKEIYGDVRNKDSIITFRAIPVLDAGYVNLYGEVSRKIDDDI